MFGRKSKILPFTLVDIGSYSIRGAFVEIEYKIDKTDYEDFRIVSYGEEIFRDNKIDILVMWRENFEKLLEKLKAKNPTIKVDKYLKKIVTVFSPFSFLGFSPKLIEEDVIYSDHLVYLSSSLLGKMLRLNLEKFSETEKSPNFKLFMPYIRYFVMGKVEKVDGGEKNGVILFTPWGYKVSRLKAHINYITWNKEHAANIENMIKSLFPGLDDSLKTHSIIADLWGISPVYKSNLDIANKFWSLIDIGHKFVNIIFSYNRIEKISKVLDVGEAGEEIIKIIEDFYTLFKEKYKDLIFSEFVSEVFIILEEYLQGGSKNSKSSSSYFNDFCKKYGKEEVELMFKKLSHKFENLSKRVADEYASFLIEFLRNSGEEVKDRMLIIFFTGRLTTLNFFRNFLESLIRRRLRNLNFRVIFKYIDKGVFQDKFFLSGKNDYVPLTLVGGINLAYYYNRLGLFGRNEFGGFLDGLFNSLKKIGKFLEKAI